MIEQETSTSPGPQDAPRLPARPEGPRLPIANASKELGIFVLLLVLCIFVSIMSHGTFLQCREPSEHVPPDRPVRHLQHRRWAS